jgi:hypothetical protein
MNHNFLPFEITKMLPKVNSYQKGLIECELYRFYEMIEDGVEPFVNIGEGLESDSYDYLFDAWTVLDALSWLETQDYYITCKQQWDNKNVWYFDLHKYNPLTIMSKKDIKLMSYTSRIEAYTKGIEYCLKLMQKNGE